MDLIVVAKDSRIQKGFEALPHLEFIITEANFSPYQNQFDELLAGLPTRYWNNYNASEGFFGVQYQKDQNDMLLLLM